MFYFLALSFVILSVFTTESVSEEYKPCLDKAGSRFCIKPHEKGMYRDETMKELMEEFKPLLMHSENLKQIEADCLEPIGKDF
ncbi:hypothetical protein NECAME_10563 [Necator americanus]|uniref:Uncharacterized protein n=1 Tax=Necator americanus TaxID=51031 RepID=W2T924_NECAM|nr:hypothetical protein NECAME_10563 [Necator americanus]ETN78114.1 hypothetical protein NECAME_10563 [Necator americanus]